MTINLCKICNSNNSNWHLTNLRTHISLRILINHHNNLQLCISHNNSKSSFNNHKNNQVSIKILLPSIRFLIKLKNSDLEIIVSIQPKVQLHIKIILLLIAISKIRLNHILITASHSNIHQLTMINLLAIIRVAKAKC